MIRHFTDHAANERTYLAWVRTAVALMGLGFVVERFDLFLRFVGDGETPPDPTIRLAGLALIVFGILVLAVSTVRYLRFKRLIAAEEERDFGSSRTDLVLVAVVCLLAGGMAAYVVGTLTG